MITISSSNGTWIEVAGTTQLTAEGATPPVTWTAFNPDGTPSQNISFSPSDQSNPVTVMGLGYGQVTIEVSDFLRNFASMTLYIGSVVIAGADGSFFWVKSNGNLQTLEPGQVDPVVKGLVDANSVLADLTRQVPTPGAVNCYVLNLNSFKYQP